jgi:gliding motility-associated-like protein
MVYWPSLDHSGPSISVSEEGNYTYILTNAHGCSDTSSLVIINNCAPTFYVPEAFTPNGDNINDYLIVFGFYNSLDFSVYSPSGILLFRSINEEVRWDGTIGGIQVPEGSYYWYASFSDTHGTYYNKSGVITLIR